jgi:hypothetical protein
MTRRAGFLAVLVAGVLAIGAATGASQMQGLCKYLPQARNLKVDPTQSMNEKPEQSCLALFDEFPETLGMQSIAIERLRTVEDAVRRLKEVRYDPHVPIDRLGEEGYEDVLSESTHHYGVVFRRGLIIVRIGGSGPQGSVIPVFTRLAREIDEKLPRGGETVSPPPVAPPAPPPPPTVVTPSPAPAPTPAPAPPPPATGSGTASNADTEKALLEALSGAQCNGVANEVLNIVSPSDRGVAYEQAARVTTAYQNLFTNSPVATPFLDRAGRALWYMILLSSLEDADGHALFPSIRASVSVGAKMAVRAAVDEEALTALRRLLAMLTRLDRPCP